MAPVESKIAVYINSVYVIAHIGTEVKNTIIISVALVFAISEVEPVCYYFMPFGIEGRNEPHLKLCNPAVVRAHQSVSQNLVDVGHGNLHAQNLFRMHLTYEQHSWLSFFKLHVVRDFHGVDGHIVIL